MLREKYLQVLTSIVFFLSMCGCNCAPCVPSIPPEKLKQHVSSLGVKPTAQMILVDTKKQVLAVIENDKIKKTYTVSTSKRGLGQEVNSFKTPVGLHRINQKIGHGVPAYGVFHRRQFIGSVVNPKPKAQKKDYVSTRILRLEGLQPGLNKGRNSLGKIIDTETRAVYIHGTILENNLGFPSTKGCVHMKAKDVIHLFNEVPEGTLVWIN